MPEYLTPGVYIEEIERGPRPIEGVPTSTAAFLGETERGPLRPRLVTSYTEYNRWFGGPFADGQYMPYAASGFFDNGGKRLYVCRIVGDGAIAATKTVVVSPCARTQSGRTSCTTRSSPLNSAAVNPLSVWSGRITSRSKSGRIPNRSST